MATALDLGWDAKVVTVHDGNFTSWIMGNGQWIGRGYYDWADGIQMQDFNRVKLVELLAGKMLFWLMHGLLLALGEYKICCNWLLWANILILDICLVSIRRLIDVR